MSLTSSEPRLASAAVADDVAQERHFIESLDRAAGHPPRRHLPAGTTLLTEDQPADGLWLILNGEICLTRHAGDEEVILDEHASGRIIGLLSLVARGSAYFSCRAVTNVEAIHLPWAALDALLAADPGLSRLYTQQLLRSLGVRVRHIVELQAAVQGLNSKLQSEQDRLTAAVNQLAAAQLRLVETGRMATIGQLVAGIAHELNNPISVIRRTADFVLEDVTGLIGQQPDHAPLLAMITSAITSQPLPTEQLRKHQAQLATALGDESLARRLVAIGVTTAAEYERWFTNITPGEREPLLKKLESGYQLGAFLRNLQTASDRVSRIVGTLRGYSHAQHGRVVEVSVNKTVDDTLLLFGSATRTVELNRRYAELPMIEAEPGQLSQVWTNVISNAMEAMAGTGRLQVETDAPAVDRVRVRITDSGSGIKPEHLSRIFDLNFTTKHSVSSFGLGMGLMIARQIVLRHEGQIEAQSRPGETTFTVTLPTRLTESAKRAIEESGRGLTEARPAGV